MATLLTVVCDMCPANNGQPGIETIHADGIPVDLCKSHAARWHALLRENAKASGKTKKAVGRKAVTKRPAAKKTTAKKAVAKSTTTEKTTPKRAAVKKAAARKTTAKKTTVKKTTVKKTTPKRTAVKKAAARKTTTKNTSRAATPPKMSATAAAVDNSAVRAWARSNGITVTQRGPLKADVVAQFLAAPVNAPTTKRAKEAAFSHSS